MNINLFKTINYLMIEYEDLINNKRINKKNIYKNNSDNFNFYKYLNDNINISINNKNKDKNNKNIENINKKEIKLKKEYNNDTEIEENENIKNEIVDNEIEINENIENEKEDNNKTIDNFIKKIYKKLILICHPDKNGDKDLFLKCQNYYENNYLIGIIFVAYKYDLIIPFMNEIIINQILIEIRILKHNIDLLKEKYIS